MRTCFIYVRQIFHRFVTIDIQAETIGNPAMAQRYQRSDVGITLETTALEL